MRPVAAAVERLAYDALDRQALVSADGAAESTWAELFGPALAEVRVGAMPDELVFLWRA